MKIIDEYKGGAGQLFTLLKLDQDIPTSPWGTVCIDGVRFRPVMASGDNRDTVCIRGHHDVIGKDITFV